LVIKTGMTQLIDKKLIICKYFDRYQNYEGKNDE